MSTDKAALERLNKELAVAIKKLWEANKGAGFIGIAISEDGDHARVVTEGVGHFDVSHAIKALADWLSDAVDDAESEAT